MAIPIISDIITTIHKVVDWIFTTIPKSLLFLFFLTIIVVIGNFVMPTFFNTAGTFCIEGQKYTNSFYDITTNIDYLQAIRSAEKYATNITGTMAVETDCVKDVNVSGVIKRFYNGGQCTNCTEINAGSPEFIQVSAFDTNAGYCAGDAYPIPSSEQTFVERTFCENLIDKSWLAYACEPPPDFYYDFSIGGYACADPAKCSNVTEFTYIGRTMEEKGFTKTPPMNADYPDVVGIKCFGNKPKFAFIGIDILYYPFWLFLTLIGIIVWTYTRFR